jgi:uncharacterized membrane protein YfcA
MNWDWFVTSGTLELISWILSYGALYWLSRDGYDRWEIIRIGLGLTGAGASAVVSCWYHVRGAQAVTVLCTLYILSVMWPNLKLRTQKRIAERHARENLARKMRA